MTTKDKRVLLFQVVPSGEENAPEFAIPIEDVHEVVEVEMMWRLPLAVDAIVGMVNVRGRVFTVISLAAVLGFSHPTRQPTLLITLRNASGQPAGMALCVEAVLDVAPAPEILMQESEATQDLGGPTMLLGKPYQVVRTQTLAHYLHQEIRTIMGLQQTGNTI